MTVKKYYIKKGETTYALNRFEYKKEGNQAVDTTEMSLSRTYDSIFDIGDDVSIGYNDGEDSFVAEFNGDITNKEVHEELVLTMESYGGRLNRSEFVAEVYEDKTIEYIIENVVDNYTTLTYAGTETTGVTLERFVVNEETAAEVITRLLKDLDWQIRIDSSKQLFFETKGSQAAGVTLTVGTNAFMESNWKKNPNRLINSCTVVGDNARFNTSKTIVAEAAQTEFEVDYIIVGNVKVTVDGTEKTGGQEGSTGTYHYTVNKEKKKIIFEAAMSGAESVVVYYEYEVPIKVTIRNEESIDSYTKFPKKIVDNTLKTTSDARKLAKEIVSTYGTPISSGELRVSWIEDIDVGETVRIIDSFNSLDQNFAVIKLSRLYPEGVKKISVGIGKIDLLNINKSMEERIKKLEAKQDNTDVAQRYLFFLENLHILNRRGRVRVKQKTIGHSFILNSDINGILGVNTGTQDGEQQVLGSAGTSETIHSVVNYNNIMYERFNFTTYDDTGSTTATWNTTDEKCTFTSGQIAQSLSVDYNNGTITTAKLTSTEVSGSFTYEMTADGTNWEEVTSGTAHTFTDTGTDLRWRATEDAASTGEISQIKIEDYH